MAIRQNADSSSTPQGVLGEQYLEIQPGSYEKPRSRKCDRARLDRRGPI